MAARTIAPFVVGVGSAIYAIGLLDESQRKQLYSSPSQFLQFNKSFGVTDAHSTKEVAAVKIDAIAESKDAPVQTSTQSQTIPLNSMHYPSNQLPSTGDLIERPSFLCSMDTRFRIPRWVAERVDPDGVKAKLSREGVPFARDPALPVHSPVNNDDYFNSGYSRGHMAAAGLHKQSKEHQVATFGLGTNILPQELANNGCEWYALERLTARLADLFEDVYVLSGPLFLPSETSESDPHGVLFNAVFGKRAPRTAHIQMVGANLVAVPTHLFKVVSVGNPRKDARPDEIRAALRDLQDPSTSVREGGFVAAFVCANEPSPVQVQPKDMQVPLGAVAWASGLDLAGMIEPAIAARRFHKSVTALSEEQEEVQALARLAATQSVEAFEKHRKLAINPHVPPVLASEAPKGLVWGADVFRQAGEDMSLAQFDLCRGGYCGFREAAIPESKVLAAKRKQEEEASKPGAKPKRVSESDDGVTADRFEGWRAHGLLKLCRSRDDIQRVWRERLVESQRAWFMNAREYEFSMSKIVAQERGLPAALEWAREAEQLRRGMETARKIIKAEAKAEQKE